MLLADSHHQELYTKYRMSCNDLFCELPFLFGMLQEEHKRNCVNNP